MMFERWAIRHKPTGKYLPQSSSKKHGYTQDVPATMVDSNLCPRLFGREQDAKTALTWWLKGEVHMRYTGGQYTTAWGYIDDDFSEEWTEFPVDSRKAEDMEVVKLAIEPVRLDDAGSDRYT